MSRPKVIPRYLLIQGVAGTLVVLAVLLAVTGFVNFLAQTDEIGSGRFGWWDATLYVVLSLPAAAYDMFPIAVLLGGLLAYGQLSRQSEFVAMHASGVSNTHLLKAVLGAGAVLAVLMFVLGEWVAAPSGKWAKQHRALAKHSELQLAGQAGGWMRDGNRIIQIESLRSTDRVTGVSVFTLNDDRTLAQHTQAKAAEFGAEGTMVLREVIRTTFAADQVSVQEFSELNAKTNLSADVLSLAVVEPANLTFVGLWRYVRYLKANNQEARRYQVAMWSRWSNVVIVMLMAVLALPFVFGGLRDSGLGQRMVLGIVVGAAYFLLQKTLHNLGVTFEVNAFLTAWSPALILSLIVWFFVRRLQSS